MAKMPPIPPASRSPKGPGSKRKPAGEEKEAAHGQPSHEDNESIIKRSTAHRGQRQGG